MGGHARRRTVITGVATDSCVLKTAGCANTGRGYRPIVRVRSPAPDPFAP